VELTSPCGANLGKSRRAEVFGERKRNQNEHDGELGSILSQLRYAKRALSPVRLLTCSEGHTFSATALYRGVSLFLESIN